MRLIQADSLSVRLGQVAVLDDVSLFIDSGEIVTIVGPNGSGKTTLLRALIGAIKPSGGRVRRSDRLTIGYVPQRLAMDHTLPLSVNRFLALPGRPSRASLREALARTEVEQLGESQIADLSVGQLQRVLLARAVLQAPDLIILDEATQGLDQPGAAAFYRRIESLRNQIGCAILMVSHELHVVMSASDRVICLNHHVCCEGTPDVVTSRPEYQALFGTGTGGALAIYRHDHDHSHTDLGKATH